MKKILSLLALLVTTVAAMATDYKDALTFTINIMGNQTVTQEQGTLTIEDNGDGTYDVIAKNVDMGEYGNYGNLTCTYLEGTTDANGLTTISTDNVECSFSTSTTLTGSSMKVKFNGEKAWAEFEGSAYVSWAYRTFKYTFGTDDFSTGGGGTITPVEEYPLNFDKSAYISRYDRMLSSVSIQEEGGEKQTITNSNSYNCYSDCTNQTITVKAGSTLTPTFTSPGSWINGYVYIDTNNDKQFSYKEGSLDQSGTELYSFSFYSGSYSNDASGVNSKGESVTGNDRNVLNPPSFTAPTEPGTYRIRFKQDWNSVDPGGQINPSTGTVDGGNGFRQNGGQIIDATLVVEQAEEPFEPVVRTAVDVAGIKYNGTISNYTDNNVVVTEYEEGKYKVTYKELTVGSNRLGDFTIDNVSITESDGKQILSTTDEIGTWSNVSDNQIVLSLIPNETSAISNFYGEITPGEEANTIQKMLLEFNVTLGGSEANVLFGEQMFIPVKNAYTGNANVKFGDNTYKFTNATVEVVENPKDVYTVTYKDLIINDSRIGDFAIANVSATEAEGTTTLATTATEGAWVNVEANNIIGVSENDAVAIRDFNGTIANDETTGEPALVLGFGLNITGAWADVTFGVKEEEPKPECEYTDVVDHGYAPAGASWQKTGVAIDWDTQYIKAEIDLSTCKTGGAGPENVLAIGDDLTGWATGPHYFFYYNAADKVLQYNYLNNAKKDLNGGQANLSKAYLNAEGVVTIELSKKHGLKINGESCLVKYITTASNPSNNSTESWTEADLENVFGNLWAMSEIGFGGCQGNTMSNATYNYIHILPLPAEVISENTYKNALTLADKTTGEKYVDMDEAEVVVTRYDDNTAKLTFKNITLGETTTDLCFTGKYAEATPAEPTVQADETEEFQTVEFTISEATGDDVVKELFGEDAVLTANGKLLAADNLYLDYTVATSEGDFTGQFGTLPEPPVENITVVENYQADGTGFTFTKPINWDKQKVVMSINVASCQRNVEHLFGVGVDGTSWNKNVHCYWTPGNQLKCYWDGADGNGNNNTNDFDCNETIQVEITKAEGLVVDGVTKIAAGRMDALYDLSTIVIGSGESVNQESYAYYNFIKIVDLDWNDFTDGINNAGATVVDGNAQIFTVTGAKVNSLQKGINIVRTADGKTVKVLRK